MAFPACLKTNYLLMIGKFNEWIVQIPKILCSSYRSDQCLMSNNGFS